MACFLLNNSIRCEIPCSECIMQNEGDFDGMFWKRELNKYSVEYCCQVCRFVKKTDSMNAIFKDDCYACEFMKEGDT